jgi:hypothetical protein
MFFPEALFGFVIRESTLAPFAAVAFTGDATAA